jgi:hypothetical protein
VARKAWQATRRQGQSAAEIVASEKNDKNARADDGQFGACALARLSAMYAFAINSSKSYAIFLSYVMDSHFRNAEFAFRA